MKKRLLNYWAYCLMSIFIPIIVGCTHPSAIEKKLEDINDIIRTDWPSAQMMLDSIDPQTLTNRALQSQYILLRTYCQFRQCREGQDDSDIRMAKEYYRIHGTASDRMLSSFLHGCILENAGNKGGAMTCFKQAISEGETTKDHFLLGQIYSFMFRLCGSNLDFDCQKYAEESLRHYTLYGDESYIRDAKVNVGIAMLNRRDFQSGRIQLRSVREEAIAASDTFIWVKSNRFLAETEMHLAQYDSAQYHLDQINSQLHASYTSRDYDIQALIKAKNDDRIQAENLLLSAQSHIVSYSDQTFHLWVYANVAHELGDEREAYMQLANYHALIDSVHADWLNNSVMKEQRDFVEGQLVESELFNSNLLLLVSSLLVIYTLSTIAFLLYKKNKKETIRHMEEESLLRKAREESLSKELQIKQENERLLREQLIQKERNRQQVIYCIKQTQPVLHFRQALKEQTPASAKDWEELHTVFYDMLPEFEEKLMASCPLTETEWRICQLQKLNFTSSEIGELVCKAPNSISSASARLYKKVFQAEGGAKDWLNFIHSI